MSCLVKIIPALLFLLVSQYLYGESCEGCWKPELNFDIEGQGELKSMIFISGHSYAITAYNRELKERGVNPIFCNGTVVTSKSIIDLLNDKLDGEVSSQEVTNAIFEWLPGQYTCGRVE